LRRVDNLRFQIEIRSFVVVFMMRRRRQVCGPDVPAYTGGVALPGAKGISACKDLLSVHRRHQTKRQRKNYQHRRGTHKFSPERWFASTLVGSVFKRCRRQKVPRIGPTRNCGDAEIVAIKVAACVICR
jgi:hypothetical protein